ncbi:MAG: TetR/AcrR family transcriptional regulator [Proteobacteria bacterium]|nr:TetR/AcrR family transcriptional regulator [Pseudomonadota bacterium]
MPAGRPRGFDPEKALDAAVCTFWKHGYEGASLETLTAAMGINRPSLYSAFGDKAALFEQAVRRYQTKNLAQLAAPLETATDLDAAVTGYFAALHHLVGGRNAARGCLVASVLGEASESDPRWRALASELLGDGRKMLTASLARFVPAAAATRTAALMGIATGGLAVLARSGATQAALNEALAAAVAATLAVARLPPPAGTKAA